MASLHVGFRAWAAFRRQRGSARLQADAGRLADLLLPGFTVRMDRARGLTLSLAAVHFGQEIAPSPERSTPYRLSVERFFLDALVARVSKTTDPSVRGYPGRLKALNARQRGERLTLDHYVKSPVTNGLVGVYATLAQSGRLFSSDLQIESRGFQLLDAWARDGGYTLTFGASRNGSSELWSRLQKAVRKDVEEHRFEPASLRDLLLPSCRFDRIRAHERQFLHDALYEAERAPQPFVLSLLRKHVRAVFGHAKRTEDLDEAERLDRGRIERDIMWPWKSLDGTAEEAAVALVARTALAFEDVSQYLTAAFDAFRWISTLAYGKPTRIEAACYDSRVRSIFKNSIERLPAALNKLETEIGALCTYVPAPRVWRSKPAEIGHSLSNLIGAFRSITSPTALLEALVARHVFIQRQKRKSAWFFLQDAGYRFLGRYQLLDKPAFSRDFLHAYRLVNAISILNDVEN